jgi:hypothetical protein
MMDVFSCRYMRDVFSCKYMMDVFSCRCMRDVFSFRYMMDVFSSRYMRDVFCRDGRSSAMLRTLLRCASGPLLGWDRASGRMELETWGEDAG